MVEANKMGEELSMFEVELKERFLEERSA